MDVRRRTWRQASAVVVGAMLLALVGVPAVSAADDEVPAPIASESPAPEPTPSPDPSPSPESSPSPIAATGISGTVTDAVTGLPLEGISVTARAYGGVTQIGTLTDGTFAFTSLSPGSYEIGFFPGPNKPYASEYYNNVYPTPAATLVTVVDGQMTTGIDAALEPGGTIAGRITLGSDGSGIAGVQVCAEETALSNCNPTAADGSYLLYGLPPGTYRVKAGWSQAYGLRYYGGPTSTTATPVVMAAGAAITGIDVTLWPQESTGVSGRVTNANGDPIEGISVQAAGNNTMLYDTTDSNGDYLITGLATGSWRIGFLPPDGSAYAFEYYDNKRSDPGYNPIAVIDGTIVTGIDAVLETGSLVKGTITDASTGDPVSGITVCAYPFTGYGSGYCASSGNDGTYVLGAMLAGTYRIIANGAPAYAQTQYQQGSVGTPDYGLATPVQVDGVTTVTGIDIGLAPAGSISGTVTAASSGDGVSGVLVCASASSFGAGGCGRTASDGTYTIYGLVPTTYIVNTSTDSGWLTQYFDGQSARASATPVSVVAGQTTPGVNFSLTPFTPGSISGTVRSSEDGSTVGGVLVCAEDGSSGNCQTADGQGRYSFSSLPPGNYRIRTVQTSEWLAQYYDGVSNYPSATVVTLDSGETITGIDFSLVRYQAGALSGRVTDEATGDGIGGLNVCAYNENTGGGSCLSTDSTGRYRFPTLQSGSYVVDVSQTATWLGEFYNNKIQSWNADKVTVVGGQETSNIDFALNTYVPASISGTVTADANGLAIAGVWVCVLGPNSRNACTQSGSDGSYSLTTLSADSYNVSAYPADPYAPQYYADQDYPLNTTPVVLEPGDSRTGIDFHLKVGGKLSGNVVDESSNPVAGTLVCSIPMAETNARSCTRTMADGSWTSGSYVPGSYKVSADGNDTLGMGYYANAYQLKDAQAVDVTAGQVTSGLTITLKPKGSLAATMTWSPTNTTVAVGMGSVTPNALAQLSYDGAIEYVVTDAGTTGCTVDRWTAVITFTGTGSCAVTASSFLTTYQQATASVTFTIVKPAASVAWTPATTTATTATTQLDPGALATTTSDGTIVYSVADPGTTGCTVNPSSGVITYSAAGSCTVTASVPETTQFLAAQTEVTFTVTNAAPTVTSIAPTSGGPGTSVTLTGTTFTGATAVSFNGTAAPFTVLSPTSIVTSVPSGARTGSITVTTPGGTASSVSFTASKTKKAPTITGFDPPSGAPDTVVTITGTDLAGATSVRIGTVTRTSGWTVLSATQLSMPVPAGAVSGTVAVTTAGGTGTSAATFMVPGTKVATSLVYSGSTSARKGAKITLRATLTAGSTPLAGQPVSFVLNGATFTATTSSTGVATVSTTAPTVASTYVVATSYAGTTLYADSSVTSTLTVK